MKIYAVTEILEEAPNLLCEPAPMDPDIAAVRTEIAGKLCEEYGAEVEIEFAYSTDFARRCQRGEIAEDAPAVYVDPMIKIEPGAGNENPDRRRR